jgi:hypothetical protein
MVLYQGNVGGVEGRGSTDKQWKNTGPNWFDGPLTVEGVDPWCVAIALLALIFPDLSLPDVSRIPASFARFTTQLDFAALVQSSITESRVTLCALFRLMVISWFQDSHTAGELSRL